MDLTSFKSEEFPLPTSPGIVYVICYLRDGEEKPFYVGETGRFAERMGDYAYGQFAAQTDYKVNQAITFMRNLGLRVIVRYKESLDRKIEERSLIEEAGKNGIPLLNHCPGFDYRTADKVEVATQIHSFCKEKLGLC